MNNKTERFYYVRDVLQNILGIVDSNGNLVVKYDCNAYGDNQTITGNTTLGNRNPFRYKGYYYDVETGLFMVGHRYYNPKWCRWLNADSVNYLIPTDINSTNLYQYCANNPIMNVDFSGQVLIPLLIISSILTLAVLSIDDKSKFTGPTFDFKKPTIGEEGIGLFSVEASLARKDFYLDDDKNNSFYFSGFNAEAGIGFFNGDGEMTPFKFDLSIFEVGFDTKYIDVGFSVGIGFPVSFEIDVVNVYNDAKKLIKRIF